VDRPAALRLAGSLALAAAGVHLLAAPEHLAEWWAYGAFFLGAAVAQTLFGLALWMLAGGDDTWPEALGGDDLALGERRLLLLGIAGHAAIAALYVESRTLGVPLGPEAGLVEPVTALDLASKLVEAALVLALARLLRAPAPVAALPATA
jgi:hypothetical protein